MYVGEVEDFLNLLKATAEKQRLVMIGLMGERERTVTEMAELLELTEPTISHHVSKLHSAGLLRLRMDGNQRFYQINPKRLEKFRQYLAEIDKPAKEYPTVVNDTTWVKQSFDISAYKSATMQVRWSYQTGSGVYLCAGWNIDDVLITSAACP